MIGSFEVGDSSLLGPYIIYKTLENVHIIKNRLKTAYRMKNFDADNRRKELEYEKSDKVYLKVSPMKGVMSLARKGS